MDRLLWRRRRQRRKEHSWVGKVWRMDSKWGEIKALKSRSHVLTNKTSFRLTILAHGGWGKHDGNVNGEACKSSTCTTQQVQVANETKRLFGSRCRISHRQWGERSNHRCNNFWLYVHVHSPFKHGNENKDKENPYTISMHFTLIIYTNVKSGQISSSTLRLCYKCRIQK